MKHTTRFRELREQNGLTQEEVAERLGVSPITISRWECGKTVPRGYQMAGICQLYHIDLADFKRDPKDEKLYSQRYSVVDIVNNMPSSLVEDPILHLSALPFSPTRERDFIMVSKTIHQLSEATMERIDRRTFLQGTLSSLLLLPLSLSSESDGDQLYRCTLGLAAAQEMSQHPDATHFSLAYEAMDAYTHRDGILQNIAQRSPRLRAQAINLLAQCCILKTILGWHCVGDAATIAIAQDAVAYSKEAFALSNNPTLLLSAYSKLAWAYSYENKDNDALQTAQEAEYILIHQPSSKVSACITGGTYSTLALMLAKNGASPDEALDQAIASDPGDEIDSFMEFTHADIELEAGLTYYHAGEPQKAIQAFTQIIDPQTLALTSAYTVFSERGRLSAVHAMAQASLLTPERDMEQMKMFWSALTAGAQQSHSQWLLDRANDLLQEMRIAFPREKGLRTLQKEVTFR